ncbi:unnamed protein product [Orchesella dallaii]|uniref:Gustatory receptor n=1 Tax=Orchesella dallaii TaxID=48710 RepID=A0ABP1S5F2_9HEXA
MAKLNEIFRKLTNFKNPLASNNTPVEKVFETVGTVGRFLCIFPTKVKVNFGKKNEIPRYHTISTAFSIITIISSVLAILIPAYPFLKKIKNERNLVSLSSTDHFALKTFLAVFLISRLFAPMLCLLYCKSIGILIQNIANYDQSFNIINKTPLITKRFCFLFAGSLWDTITDGIASYPVMVQGFKNSEFSSLPSTLGIDNPTLSVIHCYSGRIYGEIGVVFYTFCMLYFGRLITQRIDDMKNSLAGNDLTENNFVEMKELVSTGVIRRESHQVVETTKLVESNVSIISKELCKTAIKQLANLVEILKCFENAFGTFIVMYFGFSVIILVMTVFCVASYTIHYKGENMDSLFYSKDFIGLFLAIGLSCMRMTAFVECGESLLRRGKLLMVHITHLDPTLGDAEDHKLVRHLQRIAANTDFSFNANGYFLLNRQLIPSIIVAVLTFTIVLAQFKTGDL